ncbi:NrfD/PsrC family molybdoenzyme membrane anchor subunit [Chloroflexota bacterium]
MQERTLITPYRGMEFVIGYRSQTEWRWLMAIAFATGGMGAGLFILSVFMNDLVMGMMVGWLIVAVIKGGAHLLFLGHPLRIFYAFRAPKLSWISRGFIATFAFLIFGGLYIISFFPWFAWLPWASGAGWLGETFKYIAIVCGAVVMVYTALVMAQPSAIPFWNNSLLPVLFIGVGLAGGVALLLLMYPFVGAAALDVYFIEMLGRILISTNLVLLMFYLLTVFKGPLAAQESVRILLYKGGGLSAIFDVLVLGLGLIAPLAIVFYVYFSQPSGSGLYNLVAAAALLEVTGSFFLRFCFLRAGVNNPVY